ncbi:biliverdin-producing heme oxygenase [Sphingomonas floccifaciens]|uniref:Biliverdin-producing heme oxygenase n=1 Tax=Sphingomonas floccifaciens TaxID=1844115 RepID=A0ABW4NDF9_9SPHN
MKESHRRLREGTRDEHERLDTLFGRFDLTDAGGYADFLSAHAAALLPLEAALDAADAAAIVPDWNDRRRADRIVDDLRLLGRAPPPPVPVPALPTVPALLGALYVVEGSRLGGRMLARQVADGLPRTYLAADQASGNWPKLLAIIDSLLYGHDAFTQAIGTARAVFASFETSGRTWARE